MSEYRVEIRIFGLLLFALISTTILYYGLSAAEVTGKVIGINLILAGPLAGFAALILIFFATGLFKFGLNSKEFDTRQLEKFSQEKIEDMLDNIQLRFNQLSRKQAKLKSALNAFNQNASEEEVLSASGMQPAQRLGQ